MVEEKIATGRRKTAVASVRLRSGKGEIRVNGRPFQEYFPLDIQQEAATAPFDVSGLRESYDLLIRVKGGGIEGQVSAVRLALARALVKENDAWQQELKNRGFLTRDSRKKERKKYGLAGARKRFQFSKR